MPSYRVRAAVGALRPGVPAQQVLPAAVAAARAATTVEGHDVGVVAGRAEATVRYTAADDAMAREVAARVHQALQECAQVDGLTLTRRDGSRWRPV